MENPENRTNHWFKWTLTGLFVVGLFVLGSMSRIGSQTDEAGKSDDNRPVAEDPGWQTYKSEVLGLQISYPQEWSVDKDPDIEQAVFFSNSRDGAEQLRIYAVESASEDVIREALAAFSSKSVNVGGHEGVMYESSANGAVNKVALVVFDSRLYYIGGAAADFEKLLGALKFLDQ